MDKVNLPELNEMVQAGVVAVGLVGMTVALMYFGLALGY